MLLGFLYTINGAIVILFQIPVDKLLRKWGDYSRASAGALLYAAVYIIFAVSTSWSHLAGGIIIMTIGEICALTALVSAVSHLAPPHMVGRYMGMYGMVRGLGWAIGPYFGSLLFGLWQGNPLLLWGILSTGALVAAVGFFIMAFFTKPQRQPRRAGSDQ